MSNTCETCTHKTEQRQQGEIKKQTVCRRYPPTLIAITHGIITIYPVVQEDWTCGEYTKQLDKINLVN